MNLLTRNSSGHLASYLRTKKKNKGNCQRETKEVSRQVQLCGY